MGFLRHKLYYDISKNYMIHTTRNILINIKHK